MASYLRLKNPVMDYQWGSYEAIAELLGQETPSRKPQAELWMGAHPKAPSLVETDGGRRRLDELIREQPQRILGSAVAADYQNQLPFLFKVLSARQPLSIQVHPNRELAGIGFEREHQMGISPDSPLRNYRDVHHKPECICALSEFEALCGFRPPGEIAGLLEKICPGALAGDLDRLRRPAEKNPLRAFFAKLLRLEKKKRSELIREALCNAEKNAGSSDLGSVSYWIRRCCEFFPDDVGILAPAILNLIRLEPGEALFLPSGCLHAYLRGTGVELMANSDNVLRCGLTVKHVDVDELLPAVEFDSGRPELILPVGSEPAIGYYPCPAREFELSVLSVAPDRPIRGETVRSVQILLCSRGSVKLASVTDAADSTELDRGDSVLVPAAAPVYQLNGEGVLYRAGVPLR